MLQSANQIDSRSVAPRLQWFRDAKYGMFLHWGLYSQLGRNEWSFRLNRYSVAEYAPLADSFSGVGFNASRWVDLAREAGMTYMVLTTRHHDGFCLYDSQVSDFTSVKRAAGRDFVEEFVQACRAAGMRIGLYYSLVDWRYKGAWNHQQYPDSCQAMVQQAHDQVLELLTMYGKIDLLWYDGAACTTWTWPEGESRGDFWRADELWELARSLQPDMVINGRSGHPGDFATPERKIEPSADNSLWESCLTMDPVSWCHTPYCAFNKTVANLVLDMIEIAAGGGNLLLNTGPCADGSPNPREIDIILAAGRWRQQYGSVFAGATRSILHGDHNGPGGCMTRWIGSPDPCVHYLATLGWSHGEVWCVRVDGEVIAVNLLPSNDDVAWCRDKWGRLILQGLPEQPPDPLSTLFKVTFAAPPAVLSLPDHALLIESAM